MTISIVVNLRNLCDGLKTECKHSPIGLLIALPTP